MCIIIIITDGKSYKGSVLRVFYSPRKNLPERIISYVSIQLEYYFAKADDFSWSLR